MVNCDKKFIGKVLRVARKKAGYNQIELAEMLHISDKTVGNIENGKQYPQVNNFLKMLEILNLSLWDFGFENSHLKSASKLKIELVKHILESSELQLKTYKKFITLVDEVRNQK
jgi:transcriptional regulator with XRE-family HTH domain